MATTKKKQPAPVKKATKLPKLQDKPINWEVVYKFIEANPVDAPNPRPDKNMNMAPLPPLNPVRLWYLMQDPTTPKSQVNALLQQALKQGFDIYAPQQAEPEFSSLQNSLR